LLTKGRKNVTLPKDYEAFWKPKWPTKIKRGKKMTDGTFAKSKEERDRREDPFDDIWVPSVYYIELKLFEAKNPVGMWKKANHHRTANNMTERPYFGGTSHNIVPLNFEELGKTERLEIAEMLFEEEEDMAREGYLNDCWQPHDG